jgi:hypothetical protein
MIGFGWRAGLGGAVAEAVAGQLSLRGAAALPRAPGAVVNRGVPAAAPHLFDAKAGPRIEAGLAAPAQAQAA